MNTHGKASKKPAGIEFIHALDTASQRVGFRKFFSLTENNRIVICQVPKQKKMKNKVEKILLLPLAYFPFGYKV